MIIEGIVTTRNEDGSLNISPMGLTFGGDWSSFALRPFRTSRTFANLKRTREGIFHVTDDVELFARSAIDQLHESPNTVPGNRVDVLAIEDVCRWYEFQVQYIDESSDRVHLNCQTVYQHSQRDFIGFNRAKHAVLEGAILATRVDFLPPEEIADQMRTLETIVVKTGSDSEKRAFELLCQFVNPLLSSRCE